MVLSLPFRRPLARYLLVIARASVLAIPLSGAGCADKACFTWTRDDFEKATGGATSGGATSGGATSGGGMGGGGGGGVGSGGAGGSAGAAPLPAVECPLPEVARQRIGNPSCAESIVSIGTAEPYDADAERCCYQVTTESHPCVAGSGP